MAESKRWRRVVAVLADPGRRSLYARIVLAADLGTPVRAAGLDSAGGKRLRALTEAGLVVDDAGVLTPGEVFAALLEESAPRVVTGPERFLAGGRLTVLPRRARDRAEVFGWLAGRLLAPGESLGERDLTDRLAGLADDPVALRRYPIDAGALVRSPDGRDYRLPD